MKITVKTTQQKVFQTDVEGSDTVAILKQRIRESQGHPIELQKIIYSGKILSDDKTIENCGIKEKDFLVLMVSKPKPAVASNTPSESTSSAPEPITATPIQPLVVPAEPTLVNTPAPSTAQAFETPHASDIVTERPFGETSSFLSGDALQRAIRDITAMGFQRDDVMLALKASFNNAERAVEYLMTRIPGTEQSENSVPSTLEIAPSEVPAAAQTPVPPSAARILAAPSNEPQNLFQLAQQQQLSGTAGAGGQSAGLGAQQLDIAALRDNQQLQQLRQTITQNPTLVQPLIEQIVAQNPDIANRLAQHPDDLLQILTRDIGRDISRHRESEGEDGQEAQESTFSPNDKSAIDRLENLGFERRDAIEAFFVCDKNEELAANYLFEVEED